MDRSKIRKIVKKPLTTRKSENKLDSSEKVPDSLSNQNLDVDAKDSDDDRVIDHSPQQSTRNTRRG